MDGSTIKGNDMRSVRTQLEEYTEGLFASTLINHGFEQSQTERSPFGTTFGYTHASAGIGVAVHLDFRDSAVDVNLVKLDGKEWPTDGYKRLTQGERVVVSLYHVLHDILHVLDERPEALDMRNGAETRSWNEHIVNVLRGWQGIIERDIDMVLQQPREILFPKRGRL